MHLPVHEEWATRDGVKMSRRNCSHSSAPPQTVCPKSLSCVTFGPKVFRTYRPAHRQISRATIQDVQMRFYDLLPFVGDKLVHYFASEERLRLGIAARFLHPAITWARLREGCLRRVRLHHTATRIHGNRIRQIYQRLLIFSQADNAELWHESDWAEIEREAITEAIRKDERLRKAYLSQLQEQVGAKRRRCV